MATLAMLNKFPQMMLGDKLPSKPCYFLIGYGNTTRWSAKHDDVRKACHEAFGMSVENMRAWNLGTRIDEARKLRRTINA